MRLFQSVAKYAKIRCRSLQPTFCCQVANGIVDKVYVIIKCSASRAVLNYLATQFATFSTVSLDRLFNEDSGVEEQSDEHINAVWL